MNNAAVDQSLDNAGESPTKTARAGNTVNHIDDQMRRLVRRLGELIGGALAADDPAGRHQNDIAR